jgi:cytoskeletal protein RodZ
MSHSAPPSPVRRRLELSIGLIALLVGVLIAVFAFVALNQPKGRQASRITSTPSSTAESTPSSAKPSSSAPVKPPVASTTPKATPTTAKPSASRPAVIVLNNSNTAGLANTAVSRLTRGGWVASNGGNFSGDILSTAAYYDPNVSGAQAAATALQAQFPAVQRVRPRFSGLPEGPIVLVLTSDYS